MARRLLERAESPLHGPEVSNQHNHKSTQCSYTAAIAQCSCGCRSDPPPLPYSYTPNAKPAAGNRTDSSGRVLGTARVVGLLGDARFGRRSGARGGWCGGGVGNLEVGAAEMDGEECGVTCRVPSQLGRRRRRWRAWRGRRRGERCTQVTEVEMVVTGGGDSRRTESDGRLARMMD
jgi:hypothetical protein